MQKAKNEEEQSYEIKMDGTIVTIRSKDLDLIEFVNDALEYAVGVDNMKVDQMSAMGSSHNLPQIVR